MQETKVTDDDFPTDEFMRLGYAIAMAGQLSYNGVAILSRLPMKEISIGLAGQPRRRQARDRRDDPRRAHLFGVRAERQEHVTSPSFPEKLAWLEQLRSTLDASANPKSDVLVCGDFNIATDDRDVYAPELFRGKVHFHPDEHRALAKIRDFGLKDAFRELHHSEGGLVQLVGLPRRRLPQERRPAHRLRLLVRIARRALHQRHDGRRAAPLGQAIGSHPGDGRARLVVHGTSGGYRAISRCAAKVLMVTEHVTDGKAFGVPVRNPASGAVTPMQRLERGSRPPAKISEIARALSGPATRHHTREFEDFGMKTVSAWPVRAPLATLVRGRLCDPCALRGGMP